MHKKYKTKTFSNYPNKQRIILFFVKKIMLFLLLCLFVQNSLCAQKDTIAVAKAKVIFGVASFYSKNLEGTTTATGEVFHHDQLIAASNHFKLNSWVRVTNIRNGKSIVVRINDRMSKGMQTLGRVVDVTRSAATKLNFISRGLARVKVEQVPSGTVE